MKDAIYVCLTVGCGTESKELKRSAYFTNDLDNLNEYKTKIIYLCPKCLGIKFTIKGVKKDE